jgi:hypothetical protein
MEQQYIRIFPAHFFYVCILANHAPQIGIPGIAFRQRFDTAVRIIVMQYHYLFCFLSLKLKTTYEQ